tara:strand:- start:77 stop:451 length:375 start_codon:yes stop_codon:yes gene_type:complete
MCPRSSKQLYSVFKPIHDAGSDGIPLGDLLQAARKESFQRFAKDFTSVPNKPLSAFLRASISGNELELLAGDRLRLTPRGIVSFSYVLKNDISDLPNQTPAMVRKGQAEAKKRYDARLKFAVAG